MEILIIFQSSILPIFLIVGAAFVYNRLAHPDIRQLTNLTITVFAPIFVFNELVKHQITVVDLIKPSIFMLILTVSLWGIAYLSAVITRANSDEKVSMMLSMSMINVGNFGLPLIYFAFGTAAEGYAVLYFVAFNIPLSTVAIYVTSNEKNVFKVLLDVLKIPIFHGFILALIVSNLQISIPSVLQKSMGLLGQATIPLLIFILGLQLSNIKFKLSYMKVLPISVIIRLVISPLIAYPVLTLLGITGIERQIAVVQTSAPSALLPLMYAIRFNRSPDLLAAIIFVSTLLSGISLAVIIKILS